MYLDAIYLMLIFFAFTKGYRLGLIRSLFSVLAFWVGLAAAMKLSLAIGNHWGHLITNKKWLPAISFLFTFFLFAVLINLLGRVIQKATDTFVPGFVNSIAGALLYVIIYSMIFGVFLFYCIKIELTDPERLSKSIAYQYIYPLAPGIIDLTGAVIPIFKDIFAQLEEFFAGLAGKMN